MILPFTRYIAGPGDYTPTVFTIKELQGNTWGHELAQAVIFTSPFLCFGGPSAGIPGQSGEGRAYRDSSGMGRDSCFEWQRAREVVAEARRSGDQWFIAVMNGADATSFDIPLDFLGPGTWKSVSFGTRRINPTRGIAKTATSREPTISQVELSPRGGFVGWIRR